MKKRIPDIITIYKQGAADEFRVTGASVSDGDVSVSFAEKDGALAVMLRAEKTPVKFLRLRWNFQKSEFRNESVKILGDEWERGYGAMEWRGISPERCMPWYFLVSNGSDRTGVTVGRYTEGWGVKVRPNSLCFWQYDSLGVILWLDVRNGGRGVELGGRELEAARIVFGGYSDMTAFRAARLFCGKMCGDGIFPDRPVYGSNNWYYAYGNSSHADIVNDSKLIAALCRGNENIPYMVIDDGWQLNNCDGPWDVTNERFPDMKALASEMSALGVRPGIWMRPLADIKRRGTGIKDEWRLERNKDILDPSHPEVIERVKADVSRLAGWGYRLIKHDFSTYDIFGEWGMRCPVTLTADGWSFYNRTRTSAEIVLGLYRAIRESAGKDTVVIGCNTIGHLCAGLVHINRTGDDTSGKDWERTRKFGVNTLAFRMMQNDIFYKADADCVGITEALPWKLNREWLRALSVSGSPLFVSCKPGVLSDDELAELNSALKISSVQKNSLEPLDWMENVCPEKWLLDGKEISFVWYAENGVNNVRPSVK